MAELWCLWHLLLTLVVAVVFIAPGVFTHPAHGKKVLAKKVSQLMSWTKRDRVIRMSETMFYHFVFDAPKNYSVIVMFTALHEFSSCVACKYAAEEFQILANSYQHPDAFTTKVFFAMVDYNESPEVFEALQITLVPNFFHFSAKWELTTADIYGLRGRDIVADQMAEWVAERTHVSVRIRQPTNYHGLLKPAILLALIGGLGYFLKWHRKSISCSILCEFLTLCFVILMTSGQIWTYIRGEPYAQRDPRTGQKHYISKFSHVQFAAETYIISLFNMCVTLGMLLLDKATTSRTNVIKRKMMCLCGTCLVAIFFTWLLSLFRFKIPDYPYSFLFD
ncbi:magnesium transporter protein 1-like [Sapajus apella]|uniref:Magnesium transporter protein 1-like n=1 Tax=Sapajus apella TaxID=9515 RepID=A0A6J3FBL2_SAPAP|nr:magnesium transporter protein 1-like [Sapajus apella]XP_032102833.1 magnesium transporter protein 1-like [Sapajus apella]